MAPSQASRLGRSRGTEWLLCRSQRGEARMRVDRSRRSRFGEQANVGDEVEDDCRRHCHEDRARHKQRPAGQG